MISKKPTPIQFTKEGLAKVKTDLARLNEERKEVLVRLQTAREMGDLSENGAYHAAKFELGTIDRQLRRLRHLDQVGVVLDTKKKGVVDFGSKVVMDKEGHKLEFTLVNGFESKPAENKLSVISPIGQAILGKKVGETVVIQAPAGNFSLKILKID